MQPNAINRFLGTRDAKPAVRYMWRKPSNVPDRIELFDVCANCVIAEVVLVNRRWFWTRKTSVLLHGAPPISGTSRLLSDAKAKIHEGLPDAPAE